MSRISTRTRWSRAVLLRIGGVVFGLLLMALVLVGAELAVRSFADVQFFGASRNLFTPGRFGAVRGNTPNAVARAFGEDVFTDADGFRVPAPDYVYPRASSRTVLFLGDSIAFGPGIPEPETFVGLLRRNNPEWTFYNSAVVGYFAQSYKPVLESILARHRTISDVCLVLALNDVTDISASNLPSMAQAQEAPAAEELPQHWVEKLRRVSLFEHANDFLRERSKLYLYLKNRFSDPGRRYFMADWRQYQNPRAVQDAVSAIADLASILKREGISFTVIISPMEFQLRPDSLRANLDARLPQRLLAEHLKQRGLKYVDALAWFETGGAKSAADYFIRFDPEHYSREGHRVVYQGIRSLLHSR
jgi:hypothetical protein